MRSIRIVLAVLVTATVLNVVACKQEGAAERAGEKIDKAAEQAGEKIDKAAEAVATAGSAVKDTVDQY